MKLILVRHAAAEQAGHGVPGSDEARKVTKKGIKETKRLADALDGLRLRPDVILTSPLVRARQTAAILGKRMKRAPVATVTNALSPGATWEDLKRQVAAPGRGKSALSVESVVFAVGHQPGLTQMALKALGGPSSEFGLDKSGCIGLEFSGADLNSVPGLFFAMNPEVAKRAAKLTK